MNQKEKQLEEISQKVSSYKHLRQPPIFEMFVVMVSIGIAVILFLFPQMLLDGANSATSFYALLLSVMSQPFWAFTFFGTGMSKAIGLLADNKFLRIFGLIVSALVYGVLAISYAVNFPTIGSVVFVAIAVFSLISVPEVKRTGLKD